MVKTTMFSINLPQNPEKKRSQYDYEFRIQSNYKNIVIRDNVIHLSLKFESINYPKISWEYLNLFKIYNPIVFILYHLQKF